MLRPSGARAALGPQRRRQQQPTAAIAVITAGKRGRKWSVVEPGCRSRHCQAPPMNPSGQNRGGVIHHAGHQAARTARRWPRLVADKGIAAPPCRVHSVKILHANERRGVAP